MRTQPHFDHSTTVAFAAGIVAAQAGCTFDEALARMRDRGARSGTTLEEIAIAVCERRIKFSC
jgi:AmiR/NasT family two-component response regulator